MVGPFQGGRVLTSRGCSRRSRQFAAAVLLLLLALVTGATAETFKVTNFKGGRC